MKTYQIKTTVSAQRSRSNATELKHCVSAQRRSCRVQGSTGKVPNEVHKTLVRYDLSGHLSPVPGPMTLVRLQTNDPLTAEKSSKCFGLQTLRLCTEKSSYNKDIKGGSQGGHYDLTDFNPSPSDYLSFLNQFLNEDFGHYEQDPLSVSTPNPLEGCGTEDQRFYSYL